MAIIKQIKPKKQKQKSEFVQKIINLLNNKYQIIQEKVHVGERRKRKEESAESAESDGRHVRVCLESDDNDDNDNNQRIIPLIEQNGQNGQNGHMSFTFPPLPKGFKWYLSSKKI